VTNEIKIFAVKGKMMLSHDKFPEWKKFSLMIRATKKEHAIERVYSELGSKHKLKRYHIKIESVEELPIDQVSDSKIIRMNELDKVVKY
jgi:large subunit ribosomal protein LX